jgi:hypothetical protein
VFGIFTSREMKERGRYQIQLMKTRNSSGVGQKIDLGFDIDTLRITDCDEEDEGSNSYSNASTGNSIVAALKRSSVTNDDPSVGDTAPKIRADTNSTLLKKFINNIDTD